MRLLVPLTWAAAAALTGCASPAETRNAIAEMNRLCEAEAGLRVVQARLWNSQSSTSRFVACPDNDKSGICEEYTGENLYSKGVRSVLVETQDTALTKLSIRFFRASDNVLLAERVTFLAKGKAPVLADAKNKVEQCARAQFERVLRSAGSAE